MRSPYNAVSHRVYAAARRTNSRGNLPHHTATRRDTPRATTVPLAVSYRDRRVTGPFKPNAVAFPRQTWVAALEKTLRAITVPQNAVSVNRPLFDSHVRSAT